MLFHWRKKRKRKEEEGRGGGEEEEKNKEKKTGNGEVMTDRKLATGPSLYLIPGVPALCSFFLGLNRPSLVLWTEVCHLQNSAPFSRHFL